MSVTSYLAAEDLIVARLQASLAAGVRVLTLRDAAQGKATRDLVPDAGAVAVIYAGDEGVQTTGRGGGSAITQRWHVTVMVTNARDLPSAAGARAQAGTLLLAVFHALAGWQPASTFTPLVQTAGGATEYEPPFAAFPMAFTTTLLLTSTSAG